MGTSASSNTETFRLAGKRALIVDDDDDARHLLRAVLESCEMTVYDSDNVDGALEELGKSSFDLIVSDIGMPDRDGYSFIHAVRNRLDGCSIPAVALTSFARPEDRARALAAGFDRHFGKPWEPSKLIPCVALLLAE
jgi:CheY-like chemotaxis protein